MTRTSFIPAISAALALTLAVPALAQDHDRGRRGGSERGGSERRGDNSQQRGNAEQRGSQQPRGNAEARTGSPRFDGRAGERVAPQARSRDFASRGFAPRFVEPRAFAPRVVVPRSYGYGGYGYRPYVSRGYGYGYRSSYVFRPRFSIGFGIFAGYPVPYSYAYPVPYPAPAYGYPSASVQNAAYGGLSFELSPDTAAVYVDGNYAGTAGDFYDPSRPLSLAAGRHQVEVQAPGYRTLLFDVDVTAGQVIPYRGDLQPN